MGRAPYAQLPPADLALLAADPALHLRVLTAVLKFSILPPRSRVLKYEIIQDLHESDIFF
jgi:hypothetical protein